MIVAKFYYAICGCCKGFEVKGHAGYAKYGHDLVCCAVSVAVQMCCNAITQVAKRRAKVESCDGMVKLEVNCDDVDELVQVLLKSLELELLVVSKQYKNNLKVCKVEV